MLQPNDASVPESSLDAEDMEPPPDHEGFLEARAAGFRAIRQELARRRKSAVKTEPHAPE
jgi:hypothetical protein